LRSVGLLHGLLDLPRMRVVIIGGGIGGLAAAVALRRVGLEGQIVERADSIREIGAGLSLWSNAVNALRELGVEASVTEAGSIIERNSVRTPAGRLLAVSELEEISQNAGAPCICVHRAALQRILLGALTPDSVRTGARCVGFKDSSAILEDGESIEADVLVGADGVSSVIRERLHGAKPPRYAGYTCWRGILREKGLLPERSALVAAGGGKQFGLLPCGEGQLYWFLTRNAPRGSTASKQELTRLCRDWAAPVAEVIESTLEGSIVHNDIVDRLPLRWWGRGSVTLLGDAAHATTPNLGQGACMALEDAVVLAHCLSTVRPVESALREYERLRIPRTAAVVRTSWQTGRVLQMNQPVLESFRDWFTGSLLGKHMGMRMFRNLLMYKVPKLHPPT
jgi:2-polyprenyl-6-methoxyphenol hydroxylase-like FAD-dependent oxidoreductase